MSDILSQSEIDNLLKQLSDGDLDVDRLRVPRRLLSVNSPMHYQIRRYSALLILHHLTAISLLR